MQAGRALNLTDLCSDRTASFDMLDPEFTNFLLRRRKREPVHYHRVRKERRVEIDSEITFFCILHPFLKMAVFQFIQFHRRIRNSIDRMQIDPLHSGNKRQHNIKIRHQLFGVSCRTGIVARRLDSAGKLFRA